MAKSKTARIVILVLTVALLSLFTACKNQSKEQEFIVGFSQCTGGDAWRRAMHDEMDRELAFHPEIDLILKDAEGKSDLQIEHIEAFIAMGVDLLIVSPNEAKPITPIVEKAIDENIPVIVIDRRTNSSFYNAYVGADNKEIGSIAGNYTARITNGAGNILEIWGLPGSSPAIDRHDGFQEVIDQHPNLNITQKVMGDWERDTAKQRLLNFSEQLQEIDIIYAHNDVMAMGAYELCKQLGLEKRIKFLGIDGLSGPTGGLQSVEEGTLDATFLYPTGGEKAIEIAAKILQNEPYEKENILSTTAIDRSNVRTMKLQVEKLAEQQRDIYRQQDKIDEQIRIYRNQSIFVYILLFILVIVILMGAVTYSTLKEKQKSNLILERKNKEILDQKNQIAEIAAEAEKATQAKFQFFTNISHEFRTPLTLILASIEELLAKKNLEAKNDYTLIRKNALRLLRLVNQLMDFRKIDNSKMVVRASQQDLVGFTKELMSAFEKEAERNNIDYQLFTNRTHLPLWFDINMLDKVIFNLLSNAFKFTDEGGKIHLTLEESTIQQSVTIKVEDNGCGMTKEQVNHAFDRFYQGTHNKMLGTGLGLSLSKEIIQLHHGEISVLSEKGKGTLFRIVLPLGKANFSEQEIINDPTPIGSNSYGKYNIYVEEDSEISTLESESGNKEATILIIEDNKDLRDFVMQRLSKFYQIDGAADGKEGIQKAFDIIPDLIISDLMLPEKNGLEVAKTLKTDLRTSHIPVILLTAEDDMKKKMEGLANGADAYLVKPFNFKFLQVNIQSLLKNRATLREHYANEILPENQLTTNLSKLDKQFIREFKNLVEANISNQEFGVKELCNQLGISRVQLYRKVKALLGYSISDYIKEVRLKKAKHLLLEKELTIAQIAYEVGFTSPAYFSTAFKARFDVSPSEFKQKRKAISD